MSSRAPWAQWIEGLETRRLLAVNPLKYSEGYDLRWAFSVESVRVLGAKVKAPRGPKGTPVPDALIASTTQTYSGGLNGKIVYTSGGHGWQWNDGVTPNRYTTDRGDNWDMVEDFGNQEQMSFYADYLLRAGATVVPMRPVGHQLNEVVLDNDSAGVTFSGTGWMNSTNAVHFDEDFGAGGADAVSYRFRSTTSGAENAVATYQPDIPEAGYYPVYTWALSGTNRTTQLYRVNHTGGSTEVRVDHRMVGRGWIYLGTYHFNAGSNANGNVQISNNSPVSGQIIADAVRFGNGMGDYVAPGAPGPSGHPRERENSYYWLVRSIGQGTTASSVIGTGNVSAPSLMAEWMDTDANPFGSSVYIGFHSNAGGGRGAVGLIDTDQATPNQSELALFTGRQINQDMQTLGGVFEHNWSTRTTHTFSGGFGEIDLGAGAEMDATIIEVAFHDDQMDAELMRDPKVRAQLAKSTVDATLEYFDFVDATTVQTSAPAAPASPRATVAANGDLTLNWAAGPTGARGGSVGGYRVYVSRDGKGFGKLIDVATGVTSLTIPAADLDANAYYFRVAAFNTGGESPLSTAVGARKNGAGGGGGTNRVLIVNGFDRFDRTLGPRTSFNDSGTPFGTPNGTTQHVWPLLMNTFNYVAAAGEAVEAYNLGGASLGFDSVQNEHVTAGLLSQYRTVIWLAGEESTADETFSATEQSAVASFVSGGGSLFVSGSEIGWDLDRVTGPTAADRSFYNGTLKAEFGITDANDDAGTYNIGSAPAGSIFAGLPAFSFDTRSTVYDAEFPDIIVPSGGSVAALNYSGGSGGTAALQWAAPSNTPGLPGPRVVNFAFPFETIASATRRNDLMARVLNFFQTAFSATPGVPDLVAASDSGGNNANNITNRDNSSASRALTFDVAGTVAGAVVTLYADGVQIGSATGAAGTTQVTTNGALDLADGVHTITARQEEAGKTPSNASPGLDVTIETVPPVITDVFVSGSDWTQPFRDYLQNGGYGDATYGYRLLATEHADELPWFNLNQVSIRFSEGVTVAADDLGIYGVTVPDYVTARGVTFSYDSTTSTATWRLNSGFFGTDKLLLDLDGALGSGVRDANDNPLDGEWTNPTPPAAGGADTFPSGDGNPGGDFRFRLNVLRGDVTRDGNVLGDDVILVRNAQGLAPGAGLYNTPLKDVTGSGDILGDDVILTRNAQGFQLPAGEPVAP